MASDAFLSTALSVGPAAFLNHEKGFCEIPKAAGFLCRLPFLNKRAVMRSKSRIWIESNTSGVFGQSASRPNVR